MLADLHQHLVMHLASIIAVGALAFRDQIKLRTVLLASILINTTDHLVAAHGPLWDDLFWNAVTLLTNGYILALLLLDRTHVGLSAEEERLFKAFGSLSPGEFRKLLRLARWDTARDRTVLTREGARPDSLFFVLEGDIGIDKAGRRTTVMAPTFIGEVAFIKDRPASATVTVDAGARYLAWAAADLNRYFVKQQSLRVAIMRLLSADLAMKVARA